jgi:hypothetical protein
MCWIYSGCDKNYSILCPHYSRKVPLSVTPSGRWWQLVLSGWGVSDLCMMLTARRELCTLLKSLCVKMPSRLCSDMQNYALSISYDVAMSNVVCEVGIFKIIFLFTANCSLLKGLFLLHSFFFVWSVSLKSPKSHVLYCHLVQSCSYLEVK